MSVFYVKRITFLGLEGKLLNPFSSLIILHHKTVGGEKTTRYGRVLSNPSFGSKIK